MFLWCVRDGWRQGQTAILTQLLLLTITHFALLPHLGWGCSTGGRWGPQPSVCKLALILAFLSPTDSTAASICLYAIITPTCFRFFPRLFTQVHLWLTALSRVNIQQSRIGVNWQEKRKQWNTEWRWKKKKDRQILGFYKKAKKNCWTWRWLIPVEVGAVGMIPKDLDKRQKELEIRERFEIIQTIALLRSDRILKRV